MESSLRLRCTGRLIFGGLGFPPMQGRKWIQRHRVLLLCDLVGLTAGRQVQDLSSHWRILFGARISLPIGTFYLEPGSLFPLVHSIWIQDLSSHWCILFGARISLPIGAFYLDPGKERTRILTWCQFHFQPNFKRRRVRCIVVPCFGAACWRQRQSRLRPRSYIMLWTDIQTPLQSAIAVSGGSGKVEALASSFTITLRPVERKSPLFASV